MRVFRTRGWRTKGKGMCTGEETEERNYEKKERREAVAGELAACAVCRGSVEMLPVTHRTCSHLTYRGWEVCGCPSFCTVMTACCLLCLKSWHFTQVLKSTKIRVLFTFTKAHSVILSLCCQLADISVVLDLLTPSGVRIMPWSIMPTKIDQSINLVKPL